MYNCFDISKEFLNLAKKEGASIAPMKLLKLVYIAHGYHLGFQKGPLIENTVQAWKYGPVIADLYHATKKFGSFPVDCDYIDLLSSNELAEEDKHFLSLVWNAYKQLSGLQLSSLTHQDGTPWAVTYDGEYHKTISNEVIENYYTQLINERAESTPQA
jgi:uncharacterized phage-associated protein